MSGTLDVILEPRLGPRKSARRQRVTIGSEVPVWFDVRDDQTGALVPGATGVSALFWQPDPGESESPSQPLVATEVTPGTWQVLVPTDRAGTYVVWLSIQAPIAQTAELTFDATSVGGFSLTSSGLVPWGEVQAAGAAAGASAAVAEAGRIATDVAQTVAQTAAGGFADAAAQSEQAALGAATMALAGRDAAVSARDAAQAARDTAESRAAEAATQAEQAAADAGRATGAAEAADVSAETAGTHAAASGQAKAAAETARNDAAAARDAAQAAKDATAADRAAAAAAREAAESARDDGLDARDAALVARQAAEAAASTTAQDRTATSADRVAVEAARGAAEAASADAGGAAAEAESHRQAAATAATAAAQDRNAVAQDKEAASTAASAAVSARDVASAASEAAASAAQQTAADRAAVAADKTAAASAAADADAAAGAAVDAQDQAAAAATVAGTARDQAQQSGSAAAAAKEAAETAKTDARSFADLSLSASEQSSNSAASASSSAAAAANILNDVSNHAGAASAGAATATTAATTATAQAGIATDRAATATTAASIAAAERDAAEQARTMAQAARDTAATAALGAQDASTAAAQAATAAGQERAVAQEAAQDSQAASAAATTALQGAETAASAAAADRTATQAAKDAAEAARLAAEQSRADADTHASNAEQDALQAAQSAAAAATSAEAATGAVTGISTRISRTGDAMAGPLKVMAPAEASDAARKMDVDAATTFESDGDPQSIINRAKLQVYLRDYWKAVDASWTNAWQRAFDALPSGATIIAENMGTLPVSGTATVEKKGLTLRLRGTTFRQPDGTIVNTDADQTKFVPIIQVRGCPFFLIEGGTFDGNREGQVYPATQNRPGRGSNPFRHNALVEFVPSSDLSQTSGSIVIDGVTVRNAYLNGMSFWQAVNVLIQGNSRSENNTWSGFIGCDLVGFRTVSVTGYRNGVSTQFPSSRQSGDRATIQIREYSTAYTTATEGIPTLPRAMNGFNYGVIIDGLVSREDSVMAVFLRCCLGAIVRGAKVRQPGYARTIPQAGGYSPAGIWLEWCSFAVSDCEVWVPDAPQPGCYKPYGVFAIPMWGPGSSIVQLEGRYPGTIRDCQVFCGVDYDGTAGNEEDLSRLRQNIDVGFRVASLVNIYNCYAEGCETPLQLLNGSDVTGGREAAEIIVEDFKARNFTGVSGIEIGFNTYASPIASGNIVIRNADIAGGRTASTTDTGRALIRIPSGWRLNNTVMDRLTVEGGQFDCRNIENPSLPYQAIAIDVPDATRALRFAPDYVIGALTLARITGGQDVRIGPTDVKDCATILSATLSGNIGRLSLVGLKGDGVSNRFISVTPNGFNIGVLHHDGNILSGTTAGGPTFQANVGTSIGKVITGQNHYQFSVPVTLDRITSDARPTASADYIGQIMARRSSSASRLDQMAQHFLAVRAGFGVLDWVPIMRPIRFEGTTADATPTRLALASATGNLQVAAGMVYFFSMIVTVRETTGGLTRRGAFEVKGAIRRAGNNVTTVDVVSTTPFITANAATSGITATLVADNTTAGQDFVVPQVTGFAGALAWAAEITLVEGI